ncbi:MAG: NAD(P)-dependent oxidoreductase [Burkholderiales bacterium]
MSGRIAVTGAGGFIGGAVVRALADAGREVTACDLGPAPAWLPSSVRWIQGSVTESAALDAALADVDTVIHLAFRMDLDAADPVASVQTNLLGTTLVFDAALRNGVRRVVWGSSVMVYGPVERYGRMPVDESAEPMPRTPYGASKLLLEWLARSYRAKGLETVGLRFTTVFGPGRDRLGAAGFCVTLFDRPARGLAVSIEEGDRRANLLYVTDAVDACTKAALSPRSLADVYNVGGFESTVVDLAQSVVRRLPRADITVGPGGRSPWPTDIDCRAADRDFGYRPRFGRDRAVEDYLATLGCSLAPATLTGTR